MPTCSKKTKKKSKADQQYAYLLFLVVGGVVAMAILAMIDCGGGANDAPMPVHLKRPNCWCEQPEGVWQPETEMS